MKRIPKIKNWLLTFVVVLGCYFQFIKTYPVFPDQPIKSTAANSAYQILNPANTMNGPTVRVSNDTQSLSEQKEDPSLQHEELKQEIGTLLQYKNDLEKNISTLERDNDSLARINVSLQETIIRFVERTRFRDMLLSALVGAVVSLALEFIRRIPIVRRKIKKIYWNEN